MIPEPQALNLADRRRQRREEKLPSISFSEMLTWGRCRQQHEWIYGMNLEPVSDTPSPKRDFGTVGHLGLEAYYRGSTPDATIATDYALVMDRWFQKESLKRNLWSEDQEAFRTLVETAAKVVGNYIRHHEEDGLQIIETEKRFDVKLPGFGARLTGFWDALALDKSGRFWIMDHKFVFNGQFRAEWELEMDLQLGIYHWAALLLGLPIVGTIYNMIRAEAPRIPPLLKDGKALSRAAIITDWPTYKAAIEENGFNVADYLEMEAKLATVRFYERHYVDRTDAQIANFADEMLRRTGDMRRKNAAIYMSPSAGNCSSCPYRDLCTAKLRGHDLRDYVSTLYRPRTKRESHSELLDALETAE